MTRPASPRTGRALESAAEALIMVAFLIATTARSTPDADLALVALLASAVLSAVVYGFHRLTFDAFRLGVHRHPPTWRPATATTDLAHAGMRAYEPNQPIAGLRDS